MASEISSKENRSRKRSADDQRHFAYAIEIILKNLRKATAISPEYECQIKTRTAYYSEKPRYRGPNLTFEQTMAAFDGLIALGMSEATKNGFFDGETGKGGITKYTASDRLHKMLERVERSPFTDIKPDLDAENIVLQDIIDGVRTTVDYEDDASTNGCV